RHTTIQTFNFFRFVSSLAFGALLHEDTPLWCVALSGGSRVAGRLVFIHVREVIYSCVVIQIAEDRERIAAQHHHHLISLPLGAVERRSYGAAADPQKSCDTGIVESHCFQSDHLAFAEAEAFDTTY